MGAIPTGNDIQAFLKPQLRIFLSVDMVNSTAFKQSRQHIQEKSPASTTLRISQSWLSPITSFYRSIESVFFAKWNVFSIPLGEDAGESPELWKAAGDELIYTKVLTNHKQALACVAALIEAVEEHRKSLKKEYPSLDLKAAAWLAGFPVNNAEVILMRQSTPARLPEGEGDAILENLVLLKEFYGKGKEGASEMTRDFIGPSMDLGFRICALSNARKFALTADLAYMLAVAGQTAAADGAARGLTFRYDGGLPLKGVDGGTPYPFFWIDMKAQDELCLSEAKLLPIVKIDNDHMISYCKNYFKSHQEDDGYLIAPYIVHPSEEKFTLIPDRHTALRLELTGKLAKYLDGSDISEHGMAGPNYQDDPAGSNLPDDLDLF